ncbi:MAG: signal transduction histidine kinase [Saprospiraceae bacterium]|jgi:signal transduction histidine kinase
METEFSTDNVYLMIALGILAMLGLALTLVMFFFKSQKKLLQRQMQAQQMKITHQRELMFATFEVQEEERERIARDLHDEVGAKLSVLFLNLHQLGKDDIEKSNTKEVIKDMHDLVNNTIATTRRISHDLMPPTLENFGLSVALSELCESIRKGGKISVNIEVEEETALAHNKIADLHLFRVVQELINNSLKHAEADAISIKLWTTGAKLKLEYKDNGKGFDLNADAHQKGLGMKNIENRLNMIEADFKVSSIPGKGMKVNILRKLTT